MIKRFLVGDLHFKHHNVLWLCNRPFTDTTDMYIQMVKKWNAVVGSDDIVYNLGDVCFHGEKHKDFCKQMNKDLNGRHILILGNHDIMKPFKYLECGFDSVHTSLDIDNVILVHDPNNKKLLARAKKEEKMIFCGHVHNYFLKLVEPVNILNVGCDVWNYTPIEWNLALQYLKYAKPTPGITLDSMTLQREKSIEKRRVLSKEPAIINGDFCDKKCYHLSMSKRKETFFCIKYRKFLIPDQTHNYNGANPLRSGKCLKKES